MHNMQDIWSVRFTCLLVCRSAIFIDSKGDGNRVNRAYADEDYDRYERLIERYCHRFGFDGDYSLFEDACTDARIFGHGIG